ncbi:hypothetical protein EIH00_16950, partial [Staphylococcus aureus]
VMRWSAGTWLEDQDMWRMSGIFRSVWLLNKPTLHLCDVQLTPQLDALYRDAELLVNLSVAAPVALLEALTVQVELWDDDRLVASHQQSPGSPIIDERGN